MHGHEASLFNLISENNEEIKLRLTKLEQDKNLGGFEDQQSQAAATEQTTPKVPQPGMQSAEMTKMIYEYSQTMPQEIHKGKKP